MQRFINPLWGKVLPDNTVFCNSDRFGP